MNGIEKITARIQQDAQADRDSLLQKARDQAAAIGAEYEARAQAAADAAAEKAELAARQQRERLESAAQMEAKQLVLAAKQTCVDRAFDRALEELGALPEEAYVSLLARMAVRASQTGQEELILSPADRERVGARVVAEANRLRSGTVLPFETSGQEPDSLETLVKDMTDFVRAKVVENQIVAAEEVEDTTRKIAMAALKYGDLSNQPTKDYIFDLDRFAAFEGNTGPYILYTIVRIKSILAKYGSWENLEIQEPANSYAKDLMIAITKFAPALESALATSAPNLICAYIYELAGCVNKFYHETRILGEEDACKQAGYIALIGLAKDVLEQCIDILGFSAPEKM